MPPSRAEIVGIIAQEARVDEQKLVPDATLASLGIASLDVVSVLFAIEDRYGVEIQPEAVAAADTLGGFIDIIMTKIAAA